MTGSWRHREPVCTIASSIVSSFRMHATSASLPGLPRRNEPPVERRDRPLHKLHSMQSNPSTRLPRSAPARSRRRLQL